jgi:hypothetical protein
MAVFKRCGSITGATHLIPRPDSSVWVLLSPEAVDKGVGDEGGETPPEPPPPPKPDAPSEPEHAVADAVRKEEIVPPPEIEGAELEANPATEPEIPAQTMQGTLVIDENPEPAP